MDNEQEKMDAIVPELSYFYENGLINKWYKVFVLSSKKYHGIYPVLDNYNRNMIPIYALYVVLCTSYYNYPELKLDDYINTLNTNKKFLKKTVDASITNLAHLLEDLELDEKDFKEGYNDYKTECLSDIIRVPEVLDFMNKTYNEIIKNSVRNYLISTGGLNFEKFGLNITDEAAIDHGVYIVYSKIYKDYIDLSKKNPIYKIQFKKRMNHLDIDGVNEYTFEVLSNFDSYLYTYSEYVDYIQSRKEFMLKLLVLLDSQVILDNEDDFSRKRVDNE